MSNLGTITLSLVYITLNASYYFVYNNLLKSQLFRQACYILKKLGRIKDSDEEAEANPEKLQIQPDGQGGLQLLGFNILTISPFQGTTRTNVHSSGFLKLSFFIWQLVQVYI